MRMKRLSCLLLSLLVGLGLNASLAAQHPPAEPINAVGMAKGGSTVAAQDKSKDGVWQRVEKRPLKLNRPGVTSLAPQRMKSYETFTLNTQFLQRILERASASRAGTSRTPLSAPRRSLAATDSSANLTVPLPDGSYTEFNIQEASIMAPALAAKYPEIKAYEGQGVTDKSATVRLDYLPTGFHAMVRSFDGTFYVDPLNEDDSPTYMAYTLGAIRQNGEPFHCTLSKDLAAPAKGAPAVGEAKTFSSDGSLRTYRLAVAATGEYTLFHGGTVAKALAAIVTTVSRVAGIYKSELGINLELVAQEDLIIYTNPCTDPYTSDNNDKLLDENQCNLDKVIMPGNYDVGHVFTKSGGGLADVGVVCLEGWKARGRSGICTPLGDAFDVTIVAHEIGHQFGAHHTFNSVLGDCNGPAGRRAETAYEPGSGSTIMSYAGNCDADNLQRDSSPYFHVISLLEIMDYINGTTPAAVVRYNSPPAVQAGGDHVIPQGTAFTLTATGSDPDNDPITFCWEEFDLTNDRGLPLFRSFQPGSSATRTFPVLDSLLSGQLKIGETYPYMTRDMRFRVTARDNYPNGGAFSYDTVNIIVIAGSGPFKVTQPNTPVTWLVGTDQTITWDVANTSASLVNCPLVNILLSVDGGQTFPITLASNTPNDGTETVVVPDAKTTSARIKIEAANNIFFDISDDNFTIAAANPAPPEPAASSRSTAAAALEAEAVLEPRHLHPQARRRRQ